MNSSNPSAPGPDMPRPRPPLPFATALLAILATAAAGCFAVTRAPDDAVGVSAGWVNSGWIEQGVRIEGPHLARSARREGQAYGSSALSGLLQRAAATVARDHPGSMIQLGDASRSSGGWIHGHRSHRSGRDVDILFFAAAPSGRPIASPGLVRYDRHGVGLWDDTVYRFDAARNWALVKALLEDDRARVQWIFVSRGLKALLLEHALLRGEDPALVAAAAHVLHQPGDSGLHDDHFHVRIFCSSEERALACRDHPPVWIWNEKGLDGPPLPAVTDEALVAAALDGL